MARALYLEQLGPFGLMLLLVCVSLGNGRAQPTPSDLISQSSQHLADGNYETAIREASLAIQIDPRNASAYELRATIYIEQKLWDRAERDYTQAQKIHPDAVYAYKLAEIQFLQKAYVDARPRFVALQADPHLGDLATYKIFLCDLLGNHEAAAMRDLAAIDPDAKRPSYYYGQAAWCLYHRNKAEAAKWFATAGPLFDNSTAELYIASLLESQTFRPTAATFVTKDRKVYSHASVFLESAGLRASTPQGWFTVPFDQLPDDLSAFPPELREQIQRKRAQIPSPPPPVSLVSFTTRSGKTCDHVRWSMKETGFSVLTSDGWITIPVRDLPDDLSAFPSELQQELVQSRLTAPVSTDADVVSFTTKRGKVYQGVRASLSRTELRILTADGWLSVPFAELPGDLSGFPAEWRTPIRAASPSVEVNPTGPRFVSFTTRQGKRYDQVRASLQSTGLRVLTPDGLISVSFDQLPADLSAFPEDWREEIAAGQARLRGKIKAR